jgi:hypothetical protein
VNEQGKEQPCYRLTRDGFVFLAMGFTGKDAAQWKEAYITAFNKMEQELLAKQPTALPYSVQPGQTLSAAQADTLRELLTTQVKKLPHAKQAGAMVKGWSKLKAHFGTDYRHIPASEFHEAVSIIARHTAEWELVDEAPKLGHEKTVQDIVAEWVEKIEQPNGYPAFLFMPLVNAVLRKMGLNLAMTVPGAGELLPEAQAKEITERLNRLLQLFHPLSAPFSDAMGVMRALRGQHPALGTPETGYRQLLAPVA